MPENWNSREPIYRQLRDRVAEHIIDGLWTEGEAVPSVRRISHELRINPITVSRAYQLLVDDDLLESRRGRGMFVAAGARERLRELEKERFLQQEWPAIVARIARLGLRLEQLPNTAVGPSDSGAGGSAN